MARVTSRPRASSFGPHAPGAYCSPAIANVSRFGEARTLSKPRSTHTAPLSSFPTRWAYRPRSDGLPTLRASTETLSLVAVYFATVLAALITPPAEAVGLTEDELAPPAFAQQVHRSRANPGGYATEVSALPLHPAAVYKGGDRPLHGVGAMAVANRVLVSVAAPATAAYEEGQEELRAEDLPLILARARKSREESAAARISSGPLVLGMYTSASLQVSASELRQIDGWLADNGLDSRVTIAGTFMDFEFPNPEWNIPHDLEAAWEQGDIPFVNIAVGTTDLGPRSAADVANGVTDKAIRSWARLFAAWTDGGTKWAYLAPLQEMNGGWVTYGLDPVSYRQAYVRIRQIFAEEGVPDGSVVWVFAPNGWSEPGHGFERYYPGDDYVDVVAFSAFNFGGCSCYAPTWDTFETAFQPYLERMRKMAPGKPIFVAQTASVAEGGDKDAWLLDAFSELDDFSGLEAVIYFNVAKPEAGGASCPIVDWRVFDPRSGRGQQGFLGAVERMEDRGQGGYHDSSNRGGPGEGSSSGHGDADSEDSGKDGKTKEHREQHEGKKPKDLPDTNRRWDVPGKDRNLD